MNKLLKGRVFLLVSLAACCPTAALAQATATNTTGANMAVTNDMNSMDATTGTNAMDATGAGTAAPTDTSMANDTTMTQTSEQRPEEHHFPWGLLGLLGLGGLLGRKRRDDHVIRTDRTTGNTNNRL